MPNTEWKIISNIKGHNSVPIRQNLPIWNPKTLLPNFISQAKFEKLSKKNIPDRE